MAKKYHVQLTESERGELQGLVKCGKMAVRRLKRAQILLAADGGQPDEVIAATVQVGLSTVERTRRKFVEGGVAYALSEQPRPGGQPKLDGKGEAILVALACSDPPAGHISWTMQLLADKLITLGVVETISDETVRRQLKKMR
jgi:transposase